MKYKGDSTFSTFVLDSRVSAGLSQEQLSELSGISVRTISRIENGQDPSIQTTRELLRVISEVLEVKGISSPSLESINEILLNIDI